VEVGSRSKEREKGAEAGRGNASREQEQRAEAGVNKHNSCESWACHMT